MQAYARWAGLTYPKLQNTPYYNEQWAAKDAFWNNAKARQLYKNHVAKMFNRPGAQAPHLSCACAVLLRLCMRRRK